MEFTAPANVSRKTFFGSNKCDVSARPGQISWQKAGSASKSIRLDTIEDISVAGARVNIKYATEVETISESKTFTFESADKAAEFAKAVADDRQHHYITSNSFIVRSDKSGTNEERDVNRFLRELVFRGKNPKLEHFYYQAHCYVTVIDKLLTRFNETPSVLRLPTADKCRTFAELLATLVEDPLLLFIFLAVEVASAQGCNEMMQFIAGIMSANSSGTADYLEQRARFPKLFGYNGAADLYAVLRWLGDADQTDIGGYQFNKVPLAVDELRYLWTSNEKALCYRIMKHNADNNNERFDLVRCAFEAVPSSFLLEKFALTQADGETEQPHFASFLFHSNCSSGEYGEYLCRRFSQASGFDNDFFDFFLRKAVGEGDNARVANQLLQQLLFQDGRPHVKALTSCKLIPKLIFAYIRDHIRAQELINPGMILSDHLKLLFEFAVELEQFALDVSMGNLMVLSKREDRDLANMRSLGEQNFVKTCLDASDRSTFFAQLTFVLDKLAFVDHLCGLCGIFIGCRAQQVDPTDETVKMWLRPAPMMQALLYGFVILLLDFDCSQGFENFLDHEQLHGFCCTMAARVPDFFATFFCPGPLRNMVVQRLIDKLNLVNIYGDCLYKHPTLFSSPEHFKRSFLLGMASRDIGCISSFAVLIVLAAVKLGDVDGLKSNVERFNKCSNNQFYRTYLERVLQVVMEAPEFDDFQLKDVHAVTEKAVAIYTNTSGARKTEWKAMASYLLKTPCAHWLAKLSGDSVPETSPPLSPQHAFPVDAQAFEPTAPVHADAFVVTAIAAELDDSPFAAVAIATATPTNLV